MRLFTLSAAETGSPSPHAGEGAGESLFRAELKGAAYVASASAAALPSCACVVLPWYILGDPQEGAHMLRAPLQRQRLLEERQAHCIRECPCSRLACLSTSCAKAAEHGPRLCTRRASSLAETAHTLTGGFPHWQTVSVVGMTTEASWCSVLVQSLL